ncbi:MAG: Gfo/Idh/MocA family protein [Thermoguttaceae bacterium]
MKKQSQTDVALSRRSLLKTAALTAVASPLIVPRSVFGTEDQAAPNDRVTIGHIGVGNQGGGLFRAFQQCKDVQSVAVADCFKERRETYAEICGGKAYQDFRDILARVDVDCVVVATPDHWHVPIAIMAARAKKGAYVEKPLGLTIEQNLACEKVFKEMDQIFQYGTQQRSQNKHCWFGCELVRQGVIGTVHTIEVDAPNGHGGGSKKEAPIPEGFDYEMWIGPAPMKPYYEDRCRPDGTYMVYDQSIGYLAGWGAHPLDMMIWGSDADLSGPITVEGTGVYQENDLLNAVYNWDMKIKLGAVDLIFKPGGDRTRFIGDKGWIEVRRGGISTSNDEEFLAIKLEESARLQREDRFSGFTPKPAESMGRKLFLQRSNNHYNDFVQAVKYHKQPVATLRDAVRSDNLSHLCDIAVRTKEKIVWDPITREFIEASDAAKKMLSRPLRSPWTL